MTFVSLSPYWLDVPSKQRTIVFVVFAAWLGDCGSEVGSWSSVRALEGWASDDFGVGVREDVLEAAAAGSGIPDAGGGGAPISGDSG